jgi:class 3 adenylate cyclase/tetratricopeptide (TPR) repeat protein
MLLRFVTQVTGRMTQKPQASAAERRQLTILFCDVVGSTALSSRLDLEDLRDVLATFQRQATQTIETEGGKIARYQGDGVLACFGYPSANENDAERAVRAALALAGGIEARSAPGGRLEVRIGIATGMVVAGELLHSDVADNPSVVGETPNLAARLQALAEPGTISVDDTTRRLTGDLFEYRNLGSTPLVGLPDPVQAWQAVRHGTVASRFEALRSRALPLVGRSDELDTLLQRWAIAKRGHGQIAVIAGDAGIGKSRIAYELANTVRAETPTPLVLRYYCLPHHQTSPLHPILDWLRRAARFDRADAQSMDRLRPFLPHGSDEEQSGADILMQMLAAPTGSPAPDSTRDARRVRELLLEGIVSTLKRLSGTQPTLIIVEDAHWLDPTSRALLDILVSRILPWQVLLVVTARQEFQPAWRYASHANLVELGPIGERESEALIRHVPGGNDLTDDVVRKIADRADGVPLYIEELTKSVVEGTAQARQDGVAIPASLHASLLARLDRLGPAREVASVAAVIGRRFTIDLLHAAIPERSRDGIVGALRTLADNDLVVEVEADLPGTYMFRHALIQDAAYDRLLRHERRSLHERIARALAETLPEIAAGQPEVVADHYAKAQLAEPGARHWLQAGIRASQRWALQEAMRHASEGLKLAMTLPEGAERARLAIELHMVLAPATMAAHGYAAEESRQAFALAAPLVSANGNTDERLLFLLGLFNVHYGRAELADAMSVARAYLELSQRQNRNAGRAFGLLAQTHAALGEFMQADEHFERSLEIFARDSDAGAPLYNFGSQHVISLALSGGLQFGIGKPELGVARLTEAVQRAEQYGHVLAIALARVTKLLSPIPGGIEPDLDAAGSLVAYCARYGLRNFEAWARFAQGAIIARLGDPSRAITIMQAAIDAADSMNSRLFRPVHLATLASAHARLGELQVAQDLVEQAFRVSEQTGERRANSALWRLRAELLSAAGRRQESRTALLQAIQVAESQQAVTEAKRARSALDKLDTGAGRSR